jgi:hypothetical protein
MRAADKTARKIIHQQRGLVKQKDDDGRTDTQAEERPIKNKTSVQMAYLFGFPKFNRLTH